MSEGTFPDVALICAKQLAHIVPVVFGSCTSHLSVIVLNTISFICLTFSG